MKRIFNYSSFILLVGLFIILQSCNKEEKFERQNEIELRSTDFEAIDEFGPKLEKVISTLLNDPQFVVPLVQLTQERTTGDYEVLLSTLLEATQDDALVKDVLLSKSGGKFSEAQLDNIVNEYPSLIVAVRGNILSWVAGEHVPPVVYVPSTFEESSRTIEGSREERAVSIDLSQEFEDAVIAIHMSERHDSDGNLQLVKEIRYPGFDQTDTDGDPFNGNVEPTACPSTPFTITELKVENLNSAISINYSFQNAPPFSEYWAQIKIVRTGAQGEPVKEYYRNALQPKQFYDPYPTTPDVTYTYTAISYVFFMDPIIGEKVICTPSEELIATVVAEEQNAPLVNSFLGTSLNSNIIRYEWDKPDVYVKKFRIQKFNPLTGQYESPIFELDMIQNPHAELFYNYNPTESEKGYQVQMRIQYMQSSGAWVGNFFSIVYAPHRDPQEPFKFYGMHLLEHNYDLGGHNESPVFGAPELKIDGFKGSGTVGNFNNAYTSKFYTGYITLMPCGELEHVVVSSGASWWEIVFGGAPSQIIVPQLNRTDYYVPSNSPVPIEIIENWDNDLSGTSIVIAYFESDDNEINNTNGSTQVSKSFTARLGGNFPIGSAGSLPGTQTQGQGNQGQGINVGFSASHKEVNSESWDYPDTDLQWGQFEFYYHNDKKFIFSGEGTTLWGNIETNGSYDACSFVEEQIGF